jgi:hypothetical protein
LLVDERDVDENESDELVWSLRSKRSWYSSW